MERNKGITLIALVITIIVLLILAAVSIATLTGDNGILNQAQRAKEETKIATDEEQRKLAMAEAATNLENTTYQEITIPAGFAPTRIEGESKVEDGLVIIDSEGNEFVWIPVESGFTGENEKLSDTVEWEKKEYEEMKKSVEKYKGFYIGRYEAGSTTERKSYQERGNGTTKMVVKRDQYPYTLVCWGIYDEETGDYSVDKTSTIDGIENNGKGAVYLCRHMYDGKSVGVKSTLCYGCQWDAMLKFIGNKGFDIENSSRDWGNYYESEFEITRKSAQKLLVVEDGEKSGKYHGWESAYGRFGLANKGFILTTGASDRNKSANIYDVAGNCKEWIMSIGKDVDGRWQRGGCVLPNVNGDRANLIDGDSMLKIDSYFGFRPALYISLDVH